MLNPRNKFNPELSPGDYWVSIGGFLLPVLVVGRAVFPELLWYATAIANGSSLPLRPIISADDLRNKLGIDIVEEALQGYTPYQMRMFLRAYDNQVPSPPDRWTRYAEEAE